MPPAIQVEGVSKRYSRNAQTHLSYGVTDLMREIFGGAAPSELRKDEFWALRDVSFEMAPGESMAFIGRNGAGKSTLLKLMCGLTKPDAGRIRIEGNVRALINLGAGFNPTLSGLENIYNAASFAGFQRREVRAAVDAIVAFAELEEAIDSPVQTYSSGMKARLGFAVAVHARPDILFIDEVLAVGDFAFQNKCFLRMEQLKQSGVTIVYVSHSHNMAIKLCERALWLHRGRVMAAGSSVETVRAYLAFLEEEERAKNPATIAGPGAESRPAAATKGLYGPVVSTLEHVCDIECGLQVGGEAVAAIPVHSEVVIRFGFTLKRRVEGLNITLNFFRDDGLLMGIVTSLYEGRLDHLHEGRVQCEVRIADLDFAPGAYAIVMPISEGQGYLWRDIAARFHVTGGGRIAAGVKHIAHEFRILE
ncbi:MAG: ABC transporter ATP-binding protein [Candidatus Hydrogenedentes bacterium]|nr:ABC transporter ATP-binding protein [Candidatus Hydrogenedentota bacterium]